MEPYSICPSVTGSLHWVQCPQGSSMLEHGTRFHYMYFLMYLEFPFFFFFWKITFLDIVIVFTKIFLPLTMGFQLFICLHLCLRSIVHKIFVLILWILLTTRIKYSKDTVHCRYRKRGRMGVICVDLYFTHLLCSFLSTYLSAYTTKTYAPGKLSVISCHVSLGSVMNSRKHFLFKSRSTKNLLCTK